MVLPLMLGLLAMASTILIVVGLIACRQPSAVQGRLAKYAVPVRNLEELELRQPFADRILKPIVSRIAGVMLSRTPPKTIEAIQRNLMLAGNPRDLDVRDFLGIQGFLALGLGGLAFFVLAGSSGILQASMFAGLLGAMGLYLPHFWLTTKVKKRKKEITKALPDALDLLTVCVEAGLGFDAAMAKVTQKWENALSLEFGRVLSEIRMGKARRDALRSLVTRTEVPDVATFIGAIVQADQLGVSIGKVLQVQCEQMRVRRRQRAEELAHQAPIKMIFPMVIFIFPSIYVVVLGPAVPMLVKGLMGN